MASYATDNQTITPPRKALELSGRYVIGIRQAARTLLAVIALIFCIPGRAADSADPTAGSSAKADTYNNSTATDSVAPSVSGTLQRKLRGWSVSTNAFAWGMAVTNIGFEKRFDNSQWSANFTMYYSAWNYGKQTRKFRTFTLRPEARYWFDRTNDRGGWFAEAHLGLMWYNVAMPSWDYRVQDHGGHNPNIGGGLGGGWRYIPWRDKHWSFEASIGFGVYGAKYDRFVNEPNGKLVDTHRCCWVGLDNVSISVVYTFDDNLRR